jgi:putative ABC transport system permease protein
MDEMFGLSMDVIMYVLLGIFAVSMLSVAYIALTNRTMFKMGLRNLPRRGLQTGLVVIGLMLATLIITAAFTTGDTVDYSVTEKAYDHWQRHDLVIALRGDESEDAIGPDVYVSETVTEDIEALVANIEDVDAVVPFFFGKAAVTVSRTQLSEPNLNLVGVDAERLNSIGGLRNVDGGTYDLTTLRYNEALLSERAADALDARAGDTVSVYVNDVRRELAVAGIVKDEQASGVLGDWDDSTRAGGIVVRMDRAQVLTGHEGEINYLSVTLKGDVHGTAEPYALDVEADVEQVINSSQGQAVLGLGHVDVDAVKADDVKDAEEIGNLFTTFFLILGLFSIAAGVMLIFMIFVMLAAERKPEMGMARAVGAQRSSLVQSFVSEGMSYNLIAGAIGAALGVAAALGLIVGFLRYSLGDDFDFIAAHITVRSLVVSYCLGVVLTFLTVVFSSMRVSSVNIVAAIRGTPEDETPEEKRGIRWLWVVIGVPAMVVPPLGIWFLFRKGLNVSWAWILGVLGIVLGAFCIWTADSAESEFLFSLGVSIFPLSIAGIAAHYKAPARVTWTLIGIYLAAYWLSPVNIGEELLGKLNADIEMFVLSGIMVVIGFTLIIVFNARLLVGLFQGDDSSRYAVAIGATALAAACAVGGFLLGDAADGLGQLLYLGAGLLLLAAAFAFVAARFSSLAPALKMGIAYPLSNRFRTGMTIAMFSLIIFSLVTFSAVNANFEELFTGEDGDGGYQVVTTTNEDSEVGSVTDVLAEVDAPVLNDIEATASVSTFRGIHLVKTFDGDYRDYPLIAADADFFAAPTKLDSRASTFESDEAVLAAVASDSSLALIDTTALDGFNRFDVQIDPDIENDKFEPFQIVVQDTMTGTTRTLTVVGVWASRLTDVYISGVYVNEAAYTEISGPPNFNRTYLALKDGTDAKGAARSIEAALATDGVQAESVRKLIDDVTAQDRAFTRMFQGFMALGLFVGIAALGVIAFRSVVERRQQIGMLRAIGYQTESVSMTFILESAFVAMMGILSGVVGGVIISRNLFTTGQFSDAGVDFTMPWGEVIVFVTLAAIVSLFMTWWPSRSAAQVPVADALRYE